LKKIKLALGIHNHQPVGNFDFIFDDAYKQSYQPFLDLLARHPKIKIAQHYSGILLDWILQHYPEFIDHLRSLVQRGQIEMMTGGFYEPILVNIPDCDKIGQIEKLTQFIKNHTDYDATGLWLAERIWEPQLPTPLNSANIKYTIVDDSHFKTAGLREQDLLGYYITEDNGHPINIFPISEKLRYTIPFQEPEITIQYLQSIATEAGDNLVLFADDGEKFGVWPGTYKHCYEDRWLERFFSALEHNLEWIEIVHFSEAITRLRPKGRVYLPTASYREMMEWAMPSKAIHEYEDFEQQLKNNGLFENYKVFVRGGFWRNFLAKYPESNNLHKKSLYVSQKINSTKQNSKSLSLIKQAQDHLWAGQCNCPYWHGVFGGLYLNHIRNAVYKNMIQAEVLLDKASNNKTTYDKGWIHSRLFDFNADGVDELLVESKIYNLYFTPMIGGTLFELDFKPKAINLLDTMTRREEAYHRKLLELKKNQNESSRNDKIASIHDMIISKEDNLDQQIFYDWYRRCSFIDHFLSPETTLETMFASSYKEDGDFILNAYQCETTNQHNKLLISLKRQGNVRVKDVVCNILLEKIITVDAKSSELEITYCLHNLEEKTIELWFGIEFNFGLLAGDAFGRYYYFPGHPLEKNNFASRGSVEDVTVMGLKDEWQGIDINFSFPMPTTIWRFPIETVSQSEAGFEKVYQNSVILPNWKIQLSPRQEWKITFQQDITVILK